jgi:hypothetical protein
MRSLVYFLNTVHCQQYKNVDCGKVVLLWRIYVAGDNETFLGLHIKCPIFLFDFNEI